MKRNYYFLLLLPLLFISVDVWGQGLLERAAKRATQRLESKTEERLNQKVDRSIDKSLDEVESSLKNEDSSTRPSSRSNTDERNSDAQVQGIESLMSKFGLGGEPIKHEDVYTFQSVLRINIQNYKGSGELATDGEFVTYLPNHNNYMAYEFVSGDLQSQGAGQGKGTIIIDTKNQSSVILTSDDDNKSGLVYNLNSWNNLTNIEEEYSYAGDDKEGYSEYSGNGFKKTGRTKKILGYNCEEWKFTENEGESKMWITKGLKADSRHFLSSVFNSVPTAYGYPEGFVMESEFVDFDSGEKNIMQVTEINNNAKVIFDLAQYEIINFGSIDMNQ